MVFRKTQVKVLLIKKSSFGKDHIFACTRPPEIIVVAIAVVIVACSCKDIEFPISKNIS